MFHRYIFNKINKVVIYSDDETMTLKFILLVEEDHNLRQSIALILQRAGYLVTATGIVRDAQEQIKSRKYHLVILDTLMPETYQCLLPKVLVSYPYLSVLILTNKLQSETESEEHLLSAQYLQKPIDPERLLDCVSRMIW
jgi:DNA-binding NtrC family response regulator